MAMKAGGKPMTRRGLAEALESKTELERSERMKVTISPAGVAAQEMMRAEKFVVPRIVREALQDKKCSCALVMQNLLTR